MSKFTVLNVSQLNRYLRSVIEAQEPLRDLYIRGEVSNFTHHYRSGHFYFSLKDATSSVKAVMFQEYAGSIRFTPVNGMSVILRARVGVFERDGAYQLYATDMQPDGLGAAYLAMVQLQEKLRKEGLFDPQCKRPIPRYPQKIAVITSASGAAWRDILHVIRRRWPVADLLFIPAIVQGDLAEQSLLQALEMVSGMDGIDLVILGRGGGSIEDLWAFNSELLARSIRQCPIPVLTGIGHETDSTICDMAADLAAPTPSAAAERATPELHEVQAYFLSMQRRLEQKMTDKLGRRRETVQLLSRQLAAVSPQAVMDKNRQKLGFMLKLLHTRYKDTFSRRREALSNFHRLLHSLSPLAVLNRGYGLVQQDHHTISSVQSVRHDTDITIRLTDGTVTAAVKQIQPLAQ